MDPWLLCMGTKELQQKHVTLSASATLPPHGMTYIQSPSARMLCILKYNHSLLFNIL